LRNAQAAGRIELYLMGASWCSNDEMGIFKRKRKKKREKEIPAHTTRRCFTLKFEVQQSGLSVVTNMLQNRALFLSVVASDASWMNATSGEDTNVALYWSMKL
jgi:hypothetical protein